MATAADHSPKTWTGALCASAVVISVMVGLGVAACGSTSQTASPPTTGPTAAEMNLLPSVIEAEVTPELQHAGYHIVSFDSGAPTVTLTPGEQFSGPEDGGTPDVYNAVFGVTTSDTSNSHRVHREITASLYYQGHSAPQGAEPWALQDHTVGGVSEYGWTLIAGSFSTHQDRRGDFAGTAQITNNNVVIKLHTIFIFTLLRGCSQIARLEASADNVPPGRTVTVPLASQDSYSPGPYTYTCSFSGLD